MKTLFIDCKYGISGDMTLSALINLGADLAYVIDELKKLPVDHFKMGVEMTESYGISGYRLLLDFPNESEEHHHHHEKNSEHVHAVEGHHQNHADHDHTHHGHTHHDHTHHGHTHHGHTHDHKAHHHANTVNTHEHDSHHHHHRHAGEIISMIKESDLSAYVKETSVKLFEEIARAEGKIHNVPPSDVHFHEVGAMDSIIDIIGVVLAIETLSVDKIVFSAVPTGHGMINIDHGLYPVPAPATAEILTSVPLSSFTARGELTTPTGAVFAKVLADDYVMAPEGIIRKVGYGIGTKKFEHPNVLRVYLIEDQKKK